MLENEVLVINAAGSVINAGQVGIELLTLSTAIVTQDSVKKADRKPGEVGPKDFSAERPQRKETQKGNIGNKRGKNGNSEESRESR